MKVRCKGCKATIKLKGKRPPAGKVIRFSCPKCGHRMEGKAFALHAPIRKDEMLAEALRSMKLPDYLRN